MWLLSNADTNMVTARLSASGNLILCLRKSDHSITQTHTHQLKCAGKKCNSYTKDAILSVYFQPVVQHNLKAKCN